MQGVTNKTSSKAKSKPRKSKSRVFGDTLQARLSLVETYRRLYTLGFGVDNDGNGSVRISSTHILITPRGANKARLSAKDIVCIDLTTEEAIGPHIPSSEMHMHLEIFRCRPDVSAIIHSHAPYATALSFSDIDLTKLYLPELHLALGPTPTVPYATTGTAALAKAVGKAVTPNNVTTAILERHGVLALAATPAEALLRLERLEHGAKILLLARSLHSLNPLPRL